MIHIQYKTHISSMFLLDVNINIPDKGITVLFGPSGSGKTCLLNLISGIEKYNKSDALSHFDINNRLIDSSERNMHCKPWHRKVAYVFQDSRLFPHMTAQQNILFGFKRCNSELKVNELIDIFNLQNLLSLYPAALSGGQKQRVAMVRALLSQPELLILDEPLVALDYPSKQKLLPYIERIHKILDIPIIYVSHDIKEVLRLANHIVIMDQGKTIDQGDIKDLCVSQPLLTQQEGASFILEGQVCKIFKNEKLVEIDCREKILITAENMQLHQSVRILIHAKDVSLCLAPPNDSSILNCVPVVIDRLQEDSDGKLRVIGLMADQVIVVLISHRSADVLNIKSGKKMFAQFKASAMIK